MGIIATLAYGRPQLSTLNPFALLSAPGDVKTGQMVDGCAGIAEAGELLGRHNDRL